MAETTTDVLTRADEAFSRNRLLSTFSREARALIEPFSTVERSRGQRCHITIRGSDVTSSYFPFGTTMVSMVVDLSRRPLGRSRLDRPRRCGRRDHQLRPYPGIHPRRGDGGRPRAACRWHDRGGQGPSPTFATCSAVLRLSCWPRSCRPLPATASIRSSRGRRAGCTPMTGRRTAGTDPGSAGRAARRAADHGQCGRPRAAG